MKLSASICAALCVLAMAAEAGARPARGFLSGPYLALEGGVSQLAFDRDEASGEKVGSEFEPVIGFIFGWNIFDSFSAEIQGRYSTDRNNDRRLHSASADAVVKYFLITDALTDFPTLRILPFVKGGLGINVAILPGNRGSTDAKVTSVGYGPAVGGGIAFLWKKYFYFGVDVQEDLLFFRDTRQTVNGVPDTIVYKGGFHPCFGAMAILGVHY
jgi:hypothetical protein